MNILKEIKSLVFGDEPDEAKWSDDRIVPDSAEVKELDNELGILIRMITSATIKYHSKYSVFMDMNPTKTIVIKDLYIQCTGRLTKAVTMLRNFEQSDINNTVIAAMKMANIPCLDFSQFQNVIFINKKEEETENAIDIKEFFLDNGNDKSSIIFSFVKDSKLGEKKLEAQNNLVSEKIAVLLPDKTTVFLTNFPAMIAKTNAAINIDEYGVSAMHCVISKKDGSFYLVDQSTNGTWLGNQKLTKGVPAPLVGRNKVSLVANEGPHEQKIELWVGYDQTISPEYIGTAIVSSRDIESARKTDNSQNASSEKEIKGNQNPQSTNSKTSVLFSNMPAGTNKNEHSNKTLVMKIDDKVTDVTIDRFPFSIGRSIIGAGYLIPARFTKVGSPHIIIEKWDSEGVLLYNPNPLENHVFQGDDKLKFVDNKLQITPEKFAVDICLGSRLVSINFSK